MIERQQIIQLAKDFLAQNSGVKPDAEALIRNLLLNLEQAYPMPSEEHIKFSGTPFHGSLLDRLRGNYGISTFWSSPICMAAADEIERLERDLRELRRDLQKANGTYQD